MAIDAAMWKALGPASRDFEKREGVEIRGRSDKRDVYVLPVPMAQIA